MAINLMSFKDTNGTSSMHAKSDNIKIILSNKTNEMIEGFFDSLLQKYQKRPRKINKGGEFVVNNVDLLRT